MVLEAGSRFGTYQITGPLGVGGMGEVYRASDTELKRDVAIKVLPESFAGDADRLARFRREAEMLASLNHPNIAQIYGIEKADGATALILELVDGPTLADRIAEGPIPLDEALAIARQVASALEAAHEQRIVHRDLKPANIKLRPDGTVKVLDFGIAKASDTVTGISGPRTPSLTTPSMTQAGVLLGTAAYMSPEQARGRPVDRRTDIWAFGCLLYEMLTGQPAFGGEDVPITLARVLAYGAEMGAMPKGIPAAVERTIELCLEKDSGKRIADIADVRLALEGRFETGREPAAESAAGTRRAPWRRALPAAAAGVIAVAATLLISAGLNGPPPAEVRRFVHVLPDGQGLNNTVLPMLAASPDGSGFVYSAAGALYLRRFSELEARIVPGTEGESPITPVYSPDGQWVLYESGRDGALKRVPISGGSPLPLVPQVPNSGWRWPEQDLILYGDNTACQISRVSPAGGAPVVIATDPGFGCYEPTLLTGHQLLLYERRGQGNPAEPEVAALSLDTGESTGLFPGKSAHYFEPGYLIYFDIRLGLVGRSFDPGTLAYGSPVVLSDEILMASPTGGVQFAVSNDGNLVYMPGDRAAEGGRILGVAEESGEVRQLAAPPRTYSFPSVSPNGSAVAVQANVGDATQIFVYELDGDAEIRQLTYTGNNIHPSWSADGAWLTYASDRDGRSKIYRQRADGGGVAEALTEPGADMRHEYPVWAPDGRLVYLEYAENRPSLQIASLADGTVETLVPAEFQPGSISFSADGRVMAYSSSSEGFQILAEPFPPDGSRTRLSGAGGPGAAWPVWSREGSRVRFQTGNSTYEAVDVDTGNFSMRNRASLPFNNVPVFRLHDSMPGTNQLLIVNVQGSSEQLTSSREQLVIVENWLDEVRQRVPRD